MHEDHPDWLFICCHNKVNNTQSVKQIILAKF